MKPILVPTDFSKTAYNAMRYAVAIAKETGAKIILLHVEDDPTPIAAISSDTYKEPVMLEDSYKRLREMVALELKLFNEEADLLITYDARVGDVVTEIISSAKLNKAGLIIMGTQGADKFSNLILGSNTSNVMAKSTVPVLSVPLNGLYLGFNKIVLASDFHEIKDNSIFNILLELTLLFKSEIAILSIQKNEQKILSVQNLFEKLNLEKVFKSVPYKFFSVISNDVSEAIDQFTKEQRADLIVTIPQKHTFLELLFNKSITRNLVFHTNVPLLSLPEVS